MSSTTTSTLTATAVSCTRIGMTDIGQHVSTEFIAETNLPTALGHYKLRAYRSHGQRGTSEPMALVYGHVYHEENVYVRVHDQCLTSEVFGSMRCDCRDQFEWAKRWFVEQGRGVLIYLPQEGRGIGLANKIRAYALQDTGVDTVDANRMLGYEDDYRSYDAVPEILTDIGIRSIQLLTNNPRKVHALEKLKIQIARRIPIVIRSGPYNDKYLQTKARRMNHQL